MSFIVKGINLPKQGTVMHLIVQSDGKTQYITMGNGEPIFCKVAQAIQIPKGHGRLIDGDELKKRLYGYERWTGIDEAPYEYAEQEVYDASTILEGEE